jgi:hypothetical protein
MTILEKLHAQKAALEPAATLNPEQLWLFQELNYRIDVFECCQKFRLSAPQSLDTKALCQHYKLVNRLRRGSSLRALMQSRISAPKATSRTAGAANTILDKLRELQVDLRANPAIFIGGGAILLRQFLEASSFVAKADFIANTNANAIGYELLATAQLRQMVKP